MMCSLKFKHRPGTGTKGAVAGRKLAFQFTLWLILFAGFVCIVFKIARIAFIDYQEQLNFFPANDIFSFFFLGFSRLATFYNVAFILAPSLTGATQDPVLRTTPQGDFLPHINMACSFQHVIQMADSVCLRFSSHKFICPLGPGSTKAQMHEKVYILHHY